MTRFVAFFGAPCPSSGKITILAGILRASSD